jgi:nucleotide-binding universal stress UspA family protein
MSSQARTYRTTVEHVGGDDYGAWWPARRGAQSASEAFAANPSVALPKPQSANAMDPHRGPKPVVVAIDGSQASINAARWAVAEAIRRDVPLRLVHAVPGASSHTASAANGCDPCYADIALLSAEDALTDAGNAVRLESVRIVGEPADVLIGESCHAVMICIGAPSPERAGGKLFGTIATALAQHAHCPVAIIRTAFDGSPRDGGVVSVVLNDEPDNDAVVHLAMHEGRLRNATVRQVDRRRNSWIRRYPDVHVETVAAGTGRQYRDSARDAAGVQLAVVGRADADQITTLGLPNCHPILGYPDCSVLLVRDGCDSATQSGVFESEGAAR